MHKLYIYRIIITIIIIFPISKKIQKRFPKSNKQKIITKTFPPLIVTNNQKIIIIMVVIQKISTMYRNLFKINCSKSNPNNINSILSAILFKKSFYSSSNRNMVYNNINSNKYSHNSKIIIINYNNNKNSQISF